MIGVLHISNHTYANLQHTSDIPSYPVGYHFYTGEDTGLKTKSTQTGTLGYGDGTGISVNQVMAGCRHPADSVLATLDLILQCASKVPSLVLRTSDVYLVKVFLQWMPEWATHAVKTNGQHLQHGDKWIEVRDAQIKFVPIIEPCIGGNLADVYSISRVPWDKEFTAPNLPVKHNAKHSDLLWPGKIVFNPANPFTVDSHICTVKVTETMEIGNLDTSTVYGCVKLNEDLPDIINSICAATFLESSQYYMLTLAVLQSEISASIFSNYGLNVLGKPDVHADRWTLGKSSRGADVTVLESIDPPYKLYKGLEIFSLLSTVLYQLHQANGDLNINNNFIILHDVTGQLFPAGKLNPILTTGSPISITYTAGKKKKFAIGTELPDLLVLRRLLKVSAKVYVGYMNVNGVWRSIYVIVHPDGIGIYSTWITNLLVV